MFSYKEKFTTSFPKEKGFHQLKSRSNVDLFVFICSFQRKKNSTEMTSML